MNKVILFGNVGKDPDIRNVGENKIVAKFSLATSEYSKDAQGNRVTVPTWHNIVAWDKLAELCRDHVKKGSSIIIEGKIVYRSYEDKEGVTKYFTEIVANTLHFAGGKKEEKPADNQGQYQKAGKVTSGAMSDISELPGNINDGSVPDDDLPY